MYVCVYVCMSVSTHIQRAVDTCVECVCACPVSMGMCVYVDVCVRTRVCFFYIMYPRMCVCIVCLFVWIGHSRNFHFGGAMYAVRDRSPDVCAVVSMDVRALAY